MPKAFTPTRCHINLGALARNFKRLGDPKTLAPVIKSNAYGHGLLPVAKTLEDAGATQFSVGLAEEGRMLREAGHKQEILLLMGCLDQPSWQMARELDLTPLAGSFEDLERAAALGQPVKLAIKCDTGMSRLGFSEEHLPQLIEKLRQSPNISPEFLVSHLACADMPDEDEFTSSQIKRFEGFYDALKEVRPNIRRSLENSAGAVSLAENRYDSARPGIALYGGNPFYGTPREAMGAGMEWVMSVSSPVMHVRDLAPGQSVSYGRIFTATKPMRVAIVGAGYATGVNRNLSNRMSVLVNGRRARQVGRICMSMLMLDVTGMENVRAGDMAWILGGEPAPGETAVTAQETASTLDTIPYEVVCVMGAMNPRVYE